MLSFIINYMCYCISDPKDISCSCTPSSVSECFFCCDFFFPFNIIYMFIVALVFKSSSWSFCAMLL